MRTLLSKRPGGSLRRRGIVAAGVAAAVGVFAVATALPAAAHDEKLSGQSVCSDGAHLITWTIGNTNTPLAMQVVTATATLNGAQKFPVVGAVGSSVPANGTINATTTVPGNLTGSVVLDVFGQWPDNHANETTTSVDLTSKCSPTDTTSTSTSTSTTSSTASTTTTTESATTTSGPTTTSTQVEGTTTVPSSTTVSSTPITPEGSTVATSTTVPTSALASTSTSAPTSGTTARSGNLPFTGSTDSGPIVGLASLVAGAFALVLARRRHSPS